jgi:hypothetical protein
VVVEIVTDLLRLGTVTVNGRFAGNSQRFGALALAAPLFVAEGLFGRFEGN